MKEICTQKSLRLFERAKKSIPGGVHSETRGPRRGIIPGVHPMYLARMSGSHIWDVDDNEFIDYLLGFGTVILGHSNPVVVQAVKTQLESGLAESFGLNHEAEILLSEKIASSVPNADLVWLTNTGSEATTAALRIARAYTGKEKIAKFDGGYHGWHDWCMVGASGGLEINYNKTLTTPGVPQSVMRDVLILPWNHVEDTRKILRRQKDEVAAVICEPTRPEYPPCEGFLEALRETTNESDILLIFDEVKTGFRLAFGGAQEYFRIDADLATFAKTMGNGFPIAAVAGREDFMKPLCNYEVWLAGTYNSNPINVAASLATLTELEAENRRAYGHLFDLGGRLMKGLREAIEDLGIEAVVQGVEPMQWVLFTNLERVTNARERKSMDEFPHNQRRIAFCRELLKRGVFCHPNQGWYISIAHTKEDINKTVEACREALEEVKKIQ